jgi:hypothetical protein
MHYLLIAALVLGAVLPIPPAAVDGLRDVELSDQFGGRDSLSAHLGSPTVVMVVTARRLRNLKPWERELRERFEDIDIVRIADVPDDSKATLDDVASKLRDRVPEGVPVLIDMERRWATALELDTDRPNLLLLDSDGALLGAYHGRHDTDLAAAVVADLAVQLDAP